MARKKKKITRKEKRELKEKHDRRMGGGVLILIGSLFLLNSTGLLDFSQSWPFIIIGIGLMLLISKE